MQESAKVQSAKNIGKEAKSEVLHNSALCTSALSALSAQTIDKEHNGFTFSDKLEVENLDYISRKIFDLNNDSIPKRDAMLLGAYNVLSGLMGGANFIENGKDEDTDLKVKRSGVYGVYDGRRVYAPLFNIIYSSAGNEKGNLIFNKQLATPVRMEMLRKYEAEKAEYDAAVAAFDAKNKKDRGTTPEKPVYRDPFVPGNSTSSAVYRALKANGGWGLMYETEPDTVSTMLDSDYGNYSDLMRKAHHHETLSMTRVTDDVHIDINEPRLSILLTCTPGQLPALFPSFENGLGSRFLFYYMPDEDVKFHDVFAKKKPFADIYKDFGDYFLPMFHAMQQRVGHPIEFVLSDDQKKLFLDTYQGVLEEQFGMLGKGIRAFVFRLALENFRYAMILTVLRKLTEWHESFNPSDPRDIFPEEKNALVCDNRDFHTAMTIVECLINHTARVYSVMEEEDKRNPFAKIGKVPDNEQQLFMALPEGEFRTAELLQVAKGLNIPERSAKEMLRDLTFKYEVLNRLRHGVYFKPSAKRS